MALAFSIYCGVCIMHSVVYQKIEEAHIRNALANELVMYHMKVCMSILRLQTQNFKKQRKIIIVNVSALGIFPLKIVFNYE